MLSRQEISTHLLHAPLFDLIDTVDHKWRNLGWCVGDVVCKYALGTHEEWGEPLGQRRETKQMFVPACQKNKMPLQTSPIRTGVPPRLGMHGRGQRSRHSGCETTLQSRHFSEILPNLILFPQGTQDSGLMTWKKDIPPQCQLHLTCSVAKKWYFVCTAVTELHAQLFSHRTLVNAGTKKLEWDAQKSCDFLSLKGILTVLETNSCRRTPPWFCGVLGCIFISPSGLMGCLKMSSDLTDSESHSVVAEQERRGKQTPECCTPFYKYEQILCKRRC